MTTDSEPHVTSINSFLSGEEAAVLDFRFRDHFYDQLMEDFEEVEKLDDRQYEVRMANGSSARIDYQIDESVEGGSKVSTEIYGAETAVVSLNQYIESELEEGSLSG